MARDAKNFVFVVGAGASTEFGLPTGKGLLEKISRLAFFKSTDDQFDITFESPIKKEIGRLAEKIVGRNILDPAVRQKETSLQDKAVWLSRIALLAPSIDNVLHTHKEDTEIVAIGKLMIAHCLVGAEKESLIANQSLAGGRQEIFSFVLTDRGTKKYVSETWLGELFRLLVELRSFTEFLTQLRKITFISFNYDRCISQFIASCAKIYFQLADEQCEVVLRETNVIHPYGSLGKLEVKNGVVFGFGSDSDRLSVSAERIKTFTESIDEEELRSEINLAFDAANSVFFLGFGFLDLNMQVLFGSNRYDVDNVYGTHLGFSDSSAIIIRRQIENCLLWGKRSKDILYAFETNGASEKIKLEGVTCGELLQRHHFLLRA